MLPSDLLQAISSPSGGRVVVVLGAGCSKEAPTSLPLGSELSEECYRKLVLDGILCEDEIADPNDLSAVADAVYSKTGSQRELIDRFPINKFRHAQPNEGYMNMAALLLEGALADAMTLNFDLAACTALSNLGAGTRVSTVTGPQDHASLGSTNLIYLHRDVNSPPDEIILRSEELNDAWRDRWEEVVAQKVLGGPITVFVGLGTSISVLVETTSRILQVLNDSQSKVICRQSVAAPRFQLRKRTGNSGRQLPVYGLGRFYGDIITAIS